jgi:predicted nucleotidyltransferase
MLQNPQAREKAMNRQEIIIKTVLAHYPDIEGIYLFGSHIENAATIESDMDIALLLPHDQAKEAKNLVLSSCRFDLEEVLHQRVDLLNARQVSTVFQKEIISGELIYCANQYAVDEFEMLTLSYYQRLNQERAGLLKDFLNTGRAYAI